MQKQERRAVESRRELCYHAGENGFRRAGAAEREREEEQMGLFDFLRSPDINEEARTCAETPGAILLDVREPDEYAAGHIPGSVNLPLSAIGTADEHIPDPDTPLFLYCLSGSRSMRAAAALEQMGYTNARSIGGIRAYRGALER